MAETRRDEGHGDGGWRLKRIDRNLSLCYLCAGRAEMVNDAFNRVALMTSGSCVETMVQGQKQRKTLDGAVN